MADLIAQLPPKLRRRIEGLALAENVPAEALAVEIMAAYLRLFDDAPAVLPRNPMTAISAAARARGAAI
jgi:hypothetical protein